MSNIKIGSNIHVEIPGRLYFIPEFVVGENGLEETENDTSIQFVGKNHDGIVPIQLLNVLKSKFIVDFKGHRATTDEQEIIDDITSIIEKIRKLNGQKRASKEMS